MSFFCLRWFLDHTDQVYHVFVVVIAEIFFSTALIVTFFWWSPCYNKSSKLFVHHCYYHHTETSFQVESLNQGFFVVSIYSHTILVIHININWEISVTLVMSFVNACSFISYLPEISSKISQVLQHFVISDFSRGTCLQFSLKLLVRGFH